MLRDTEAITVVIDQPLANKYQSALDITLTNIKMLED